MTYRNDSERFRADWGDPSLTPISTPESASAGLSANYCAHCTKQQDQPNENVVDFWRHHGVPLVGWDVFIIAGLVPDLPAITIKCELVDAMHHPTRWWRLDIVNFLTVTTAANAIKDDTTNDYSTDNVPKGIR